MYRKIGTEVRGPEIKNNIINKIISGIVRF